MAAKKTETTEATVDRTVADGQTRRFRCTRKCYWNFTRWYSANEVKEPSIVEFPGPGTIPDSFQFENWEEI